MVYESPAAGRIVACRKHSPWTMDRDRKKSKARLGSPECQDIVSEGIEEEEEEPDDHEMTEQEAEMLACLGQLRMTSLLGGHGDVHGSSLPRSDSAPEGQRRKVRGSRALSTSYQTRLRSCMINDKGSPVAHGSRSYTHSGDRGQENTPPVMFVASEQSKCWLVRRQSPPAEASTTASHLQRCASSTTALQVRNHVQTSAADQSLTTAAAVSNCSRLKQELQQEFDDSPAPKSRAHRRSQSGAGADAPGAHVLTDSAETLHGHASCASGVPSQSESVKGFMSDRPHGATSVVGCSSLPLFGSQVASQAQHQGSCQPAQALDSHGRCPTTTSHTFVPGPSIRSSSFGSSSASCAPVAKYGIAAFGVPASVQSCFAGPISASAARQEPTASDAEPRPLELSRFAAVSSVRPFSDTFALFSPLTSGEATGIGAGDCTAAADADRPHSNVSSPLGTSLSPLVGGLGRCANLGAAGGHGKALADSAEEIELRRLAQQHPHAPTQQPQCLPQPLEQRPSFKAPGNSFIGAATALAAPFPGSAPGAASVFPLAPFDLAALARSNLYSTSFMPDPNATSVAPAAAAAVDNFLSSAPELLRATSGPHLAIAECSPVPCGATAARRKQQQLQQRDKLCQDQHDTLDGRRGGAAGAMEQDICGTGPRTPGFALFGQHAFGRGADGAPGSCGGAACVNDDECEDGTPWLRTSQQVPDPDDPSSADKYSQVLLMRLQAAAEHEELYSAAAAAAAGRSEPCGLYHLQGPGSSGLRYGDGYARRPFGSNSSSMEPSPMPRLSSRLRRLRASPYAGGSGGIGTGGPLTSPPPSQLGTRSRSAGVTPGGTSRRLRRRSDLISVRGSGDIDELEDEECDADDLMLDISHQHHASRPARGHAEPWGIPSARACASGSQGQPLSAPLPWLAGSCDDVDGKPSNGEQLRQRGTSAGGAAPLRPSQPPHGGGHAAAGANRNCLEHSQRRHPQQRSHSQPGEEFLSGLMDYDDDGAEFSTPPHTPLRGIGAAHEHDATAATRPLPETADTVLESTGPAPARVPGNRCLFDDSCSGGRRLRGVPATRSHEYHPHHAAAGTRHSNSDGCAYGAMEWLASETQGSTQEFNKWIGLAANNSDRGSAERLWHEMCSRCVAPDIHTLNALLRCLSRSAADPDEAKLLALEVCGRGGFSPNGTTQRLLEEICFRFEQLNGSLLAA